MATGTLSLVAKVEAGVTVKWSFNVMGMKAGAVMGCRTSKSQGFPNAWRAGSVSGSCQVGGSLPGGGRVWREALIETCGSHFDYPLKSLIILKNTWVFGVTRVSRLLKSP